MASHPPSLAESQKHSTPSDITPTMTDHLVDSSETRGVDFAKRPPSAAQSLPRAISPEKPAMNLPEPHSDNQPTGRTCSEIKALLGTNSEGDSFEPKHLETGCWMRLLAYDALQSSDDRLIGKNGGSVGAEPWC